MVFPVLVVQTRISEAIAPSVCEIDELAAVLLSAISASARAADPLAKSLDELAHTCTSPAMPPD